MMGCEKRMFIFTAIMNCAITRRIGGGLLGIIQEGGSETQDINAKHYVQLENLQHVLMNCDHSSALHIRHKRPDPVRYQLWCLQGMVVVDGSRN